ncbi:MAG: hypothetical protein J0L92_27155 [Deltaproteobacteria bacterium]|nr:hypothetical protein [Deltaproteobacteria bacterium]
MTNNVRAVLLGSLLLLSPLDVLADAPPPSQSLASDPEPPRPQYGLSAEAASIPLGDYAARLDVLVVPALSLGLSAGASHRRATDDVLLEGNLTLWCLGVGLEGPFVTAVAGLAWAGPWNQTTGIVGRLGGEAGWQFLWQSLSIGLGAGVHAALTDANDPQPELRLRVALGLVF